MKWVRRQRTPAGKRYGQAKRPGMGTRWQEADWCAIDLELTGLDPRADHIIAVGMVPISGGRAQLGGAQYSLVATERNSSLGALLTHRLRREELRGAPPLSEAMELIIDMLAGRVPVFHYAVVEQRFLGPHLARRRVRMPPAADTEQLGRVWLAQRAAQSPGSSEPPTSLTSPTASHALSLDALARVLGQRPEPAHHALADAISTAQAFIALAALLGAGGPPQTVGTLLGASLRTAAGSGRAPTA